jgi:hypothetical protein
MKILMLENIPFGGDVKIGSHHYATHFAASGHDVMFMPLPAHVFSMLGGRLGKLRQLTPVRPRRIGASLRELVPFTVLPYRQSFLARSPRVYAAQPALCLHARLLLAAHGFAAPDLVWITDPRWEWILPHLQFRHLVYRRCDSFTDFSDVPPAIREVEERLMSRANLVYYTDVNLRPERWAQKARLLNNACEFDKFNRFAATRTVGRTVKLGFTGALGEWFDVQAVAALSRALGEEVDIHLWGPVRTDVGPLRGLGNVALHGTIPYERLGDAYAQVDALMIPFRMTELGSTINPIKLYEGLATGRPMIVPDLPNLRALGAPLRFYRRPEELVELVRGLASRMLEPDGAGVDFGRRNSWAARAETVLRALGEFA